jgi:hypothetical protein
MFLGPRHTDAVPTGCWRSLQAVAGRDRLPATFHVPLRGHSARSRPPHVPHQGQQTSTGVRRRPLGVSEVCCYERLPLPQRSEKPGGGRHSAEERDAM